LLFLFINDLPLNCADASFQLYADDAVLYASAKSPELAADVLSDVWLMSDNGSIKISWC